MSFNCLNNESETFRDYFCDISLISSVCRVCLEKNQGNKKMLNIFDIQEPKIPSLMMACADVQVAVGDGLPNMICSKCFAKLNIAWQFKLLIEKSYSKLRECYYNNQVHHISVDFEDSLDSLLKRDHALLPNVASSSEASITEPEKEIEPSNEAQKEELPTKKTKEKVDKKKTKLHQCCICGKTFYRKEYLTQHIRIHTGEKPYQCHLCDKRFVNSGHLATHMRTHTGEKPHSCTLCPKAFSTRQELRKHTMVHNGERPFACTVCNKTFGTSSNLYAHLKHHTGEKNFTCEHCGKAFYSKQELRQHVVIHTGEKAHLCEYCDKRFSQIAHLRRHYKLHK